MFSLGQIAFFDRTILFLIEGSAKERLLSHLLPKRLFNSLAFIQNELESLKPALKKDRNPLSQPLKRIKKDRNPLSQPLKRIGLP